MARALLAGAIRPSPSGVAEARALVANAVTGAVVLALGNLAIFASPPILARACAVEAVAMESLAISALSKTTIASIKSGVAHTATTHALAVPVAVACAAKIDSARGTTKSIGAHAHTIHALAIITRRTLPGVAVHPLEAVVTLTCRLLACSVTTAIVRAHLDLTLVTRPSSITLACTINTLAVHARGGAHVNTAVVTRVQANAEALAISAFSMATAVVWAPLLRTIVSLVARFAHTLQVNTLPMSRATRWALSLRTVEACETWVTLALRTFTLSVVVAVVGADRSCARCAFERRVAEANTFLAQAILAIAVIWALA